MLTYIRKTRLGEPVHDQLPRALQLNPTPRPRSILDRSRTRGVVPSRKMGGMMPWSEPLERDYMLLLEFDRGIAAYECLPSAGAITVRLRDQDWRFVPCFALRPLAGPLTYVSTCTPEQAQHHDHETIVALIREQYDDAQTGFSLVTPVEIYRQPRFENLQLLQYAARGRFPPEWPLWLAEWLAGEAPTSISTLEERLGGGKEVRRQILSMVAAGILEIDLVSPIGDDTLVSCMR